MDNTLSVSQLIEQLQPHSQSAKVIAVLPGGKMFSVTEVNVVTDPQREQMVFVRIDEQLDQVEKRFRRGEPVAANGTVHYRWEGAEMFCGLVVQDPRRTTEHVGKIPDCDRCLELHDGA